MAKKPKTLYLKGNSRSALLSFSATIRADAGEALWQVQNGNSPHDWKPMTGIGPGVREIRVSDDSGAFRVIYIASLPDAIYVLHAFQKKTQKTMKRDLDLATARLKQIVRGRAG